MCALLLLLRVGERMEQGEQKQPGWVKRNATDDDYREALQKRQAEHEKRMQEHLEHKRADYPRMKFSTPVTPQQVRRADKYLKDTRPQLNSIRCDRPIPYRKLPDVVQWRNEERAEHRDHRDYYRRGKAEPDTGGPAALPRVATRDLAPKDGSAASWRLHVRKVGRQGGYYVARLRWKERKALYDAEDLKVACDLVQQGT